MLVSIEAAPPGPLRILPELPDARLATLEGLNGIGKTLAVRLLQACTGVRPYPPGSASWLSMCSGLGEFQVTITDLNGPKEMRWQADTRDWASVEPEQDLPFRSITVDGQAVGIDAARALLSVHRIAGDEGIVETLALEATSFADSVQRSSRRLAGSESGPLVALERMVQDAAQRVTAVTVDQFARLSERAQSLNEVSRDADRSVEESAELLDKVERACELREQLVEVESRSPDIASRIQGIDSAITKARAEHDALQVEFGTLAAAAAGAAISIRELELARLNLQRNQAKYSLALSQAAAAASPLGIAPTKADTTAAKTEAQTLIDRLSVELMSMDSVPAMRALLGSLVGELAGAEQRGLGDQTALIDDEFGYQSSVSRLRRGVASRAETLGQQPSPPEAVRVREQLLQAQRRLSLLQDLERKISDVERFERLVRSSEERVDAAMTASDPQVAARLREVEGARRAKDEALMQLAAERAALAQQLGSLTQGFSEASLRAQLTTALEGLAAHESDLDHLLASTSELAARASDDRQRLRRDALDAAHAVAQAATEAKRSAGELLTSESLLWLREAMDLNDLLLDKGTKDILTGIAAVRLRLETVTERLGAHRAQLAAVETALRGIARHLRSEDPRAEEYLVELQSWLGYKFSDWFNHDRVRKEILPSASGAVEVDVSAGEVRWHEGKKARARPLEAFSSGEQAFAYTRAQLGLLDEQDPRAPNRLIVLDEFGAFIAHDRLSALLDYLRTRVSLHPEDQVLVILPLGNNYEQLAQSSIGDEAERFQRLADEVRARRYAVLKIVA